MSGGACDFVIPFSFHQNLCTTQSNKSSFQFSNTDANDLVRLERYNQISNNSTSPPTNNRNHEARSNVQAEHQREHSTHRSTDAQPQTQATQQCANNQSVPSETPQFRSPLLLKSQRLRCRFRRRRHAHPLPRQDSRKHTQSLHREPITTHHPPIPSHLRPSKLTSPPQATTGEFVGTSLFLLLALSGAQVANTVPSSAGLTVLDIGSNAQQLQYIAL